MVISCVRWLVIDRIHAWTGLTAPAWDDAKLADRVAAFDYLVESHYRYYQFVANALVAVLLTYSVHRWRATLPLLGLGSDAAVLLLCVVLFAASRDALAKYYKRTNHLVGQDLNAPILGEPCTTETTMHTRPGPTRRPPLQSRHQTTSALHNPGRVRGSRRRQGSRKIAAED
jgi:hypothetical protein